MTQRRGFFNSIDGPRADLLITSGLREPVKSCKILRRAGQPALPFPARGLNEPRVPR